MKPIKNRNRSKYSFANINFLDVCNVDCFFCLGKDIKDELSDKRSLSVPFQEFKNFDLFLDRCKELSIRKIYLTGQNTDPLMYKYLREIINHLQDNCFDVGIRTNGYLALEKMDIINLCKEEIGYSIHTINSDTSIKILGRSDIPEWGKILDQTTAPCRVSIVVNRYNVDEIDNLLFHISSRSNVRYIQLRRVSTDTRYEELKEDVDVFEKFYELFKWCYPQKAEYETASVHEVYNKKDVVIWRTVSTTANSINYFTDGTLSDEYFIVEGYMKNRIGGENG